MQLLPLLTHGLLAAVYGLVVTGALYAFGPIPAPFVAALVVSALFYGREAAPLEHDLKHRGVKGVAAWFGAMSSWRWTLDNRLQWLVPTAVAVGLAFAARALGA